MKNLLFLFLIASLCACSGGTDSTAKNAANNYPASTDKIHWVSLEEAESMSKAKPKEVMIDVYTPWCGPCKMLDKMTFNDPGVIDHVGKNYYAVKFNAESPDAVKFAGKEYSNPEFDPNKNPRGRNSPHQLTREFFQVRGYPTIVVLDESLGIKDKHVGFKKPDQLLPLLK